MSETQSSYRQILKATSLFGGVQIISILISIIRSKFIAIFIGPMGMGIAGLLTSTINLISKVTRLGLDTSAVKEIALFSSVKEEKLLVIISALRKIIWYTGLFAALITLLGASFLSQLTFDSSKYTVSFIWLAVTLLFNQLTNGEMAILQGLRKHRYLAKANLYANICVLLVVVPLYYFYRIDGIVPAIIISSIIAFFFGKYFTNKLHLKTVKLSKGETLRQGRSMLQLGVMLSIGSSITMLSTYAVQIFISHSGGIKEVGYYLAGFVIINNYVGVVFNAIQTDYFPRLSAVAQNLQKLKITVGEQTEITVLVITPIIIIFLVLAPWAISILYSSEFLTITLFVSWGVFGTLFKAVAWCLSYIILARGDSKLYVKTTLFFNVVFIILMFSGYYFLGLKGVGIAYFIYHILHLLAIQVISYYKYQVNFNSNFYRMFLISFFLCFFTFLLTFLQVSMLIFFLMISLVLIAGVFSFWQLNKRVDILTFLEGKISKKN